jgi:hypothetical protein
MVMVVPIPSVPGAIEAEPFICTAPAKLAGEARFSCHDEFVDPKCTGDASESNPPLG